MSIFAVSIVSFFNLVMSTIAYNGLVDFLCSALSPNDMRIVATELLERASSAEQSLKPYTMEDIYAMIEQSKKDSAAGLGQDSEDMFRELEEEFDREDQIELAEAV